jgi:hypothetical protein
MAMNYERRRFGGLSLPKHSVQAPGPLLQLAARFAAETQCATPPSRALQRLLAELPGHLSTRVLRERHLAVLERVAFAWDQPRALRDCIDDAMFAPKPGERPLCYEAIEELVELKEYAYRVRWGVRPSVWDEALGLV